MIFEPYQDELEYIDNIHKYNENDYTIIRLTDTMLKKSIIDANVFVQDLFQKYDIVNYADLNEGDKEKIKIDVYSDNQNFEATMSCYRANTRGDERFWIYGKKFKSNFQTGDLLYITINSDSTKVVVINVSTNSLSEEKLSMIFGIDKIEDALSRLLPKVRDIAKEGFHPNSKGSGKITPKDAGDTLEYLLGIKANNSQKADFEDLIELKSKMSKTLDTLFTLRPQFDGTPVAEFESNDRRRVSAFARLYGYESEKHPNMNSLYITIGSKSSPQNNQGFYLEVNEKERTVEIKKEEGSKSHTAAFWGFEDLETELHLKHPATLWVKAESRMNDDTAEFKYVSAELTRSPQFMTFISLIESGVITYDWRGYISKEGKYTGKNHGNAWRIKNKQRNLLFGSTEIVDLGIESNK